MKLDILAVSAVVLSALLSSSSSGSVVEAFSAPAVPGTTTAAQIDKTMRNVDKDDKATFDPTKGDQPALVRNNKDQVWVEQVRSCVVCLLVLVVFSCCSCNFGNTLLYS